MILSVPYFMGEPMLDFDVPEPNEPVQPALDEGSPQQRMGALYRHLAASVAALQSPVVFAGDCVAAIGVLAGLQRRGIDPVLVWFDAHGDFNTWETTPTGFLGGMPLAMIVGRGEQTIAAAAGLGPIAESNAVLVGGRDLDPGEDAALASSALLQIEVDEVDATLAAGRPLYVHVDIDVVDPSEMPAVNYPAPGGPGLDAVAAALERLSATDRVVALSFSCWNPALPSARTAAAATARLAGSVLMH